MEPNAPEFIGFSKIARLSRDIVVTEKIDGTNAQLLIGEDGSFHVGSRHRWITLENDNYGFVRWANDHRDELMALGPGRHFGEWWGCGIQRGYGLKEKRFSLFNCGRWSAATVPACVDVVPILYRGEFTSEAVDRCLGTLRNNGSAVAPGFMKPEGIVVYHTAANALFKKTLDADAQPKSLHLSLAA